MAILRAVLILFICISISYAEPQRIISLSPSATETLYYLGVGNKIVAVTDYCNWPEDTKSKVKIGGMLNPSYEKILALKPDLVIVSRDGTPLEVYQRLIDLGLRVYVFNPKNLSDLPNEIIKLAQIMGKHKVAQSITEKFSKDLREFHNIHNGKRALFIVWSENLTVAGNKTHVGEIMRLLGLRNIAKDHYPQYNLERIIREDPEIIFIGRGHEVNMDLTVLEKLKDTKAVKKGNVFFVSEKIYRLSPRIIEGIKEMAEVKVKD